MFAEISFLFLKFLRCFQELHRKALQLIQWALNGSRLDIFDDIMR